MKKNKLFKILAITLLVIALLTWLIPAGNYTGEFVDAGIQRLGFIDFCQYLILPFFQSMFIEVLLFLLAVGAFYGILSKTGAYKNSIEKIAKKFKKKGTLVLIITAFVIAALSSVGGYGLLLFVFIPMIISIILLMGYNKVTAFLITFGSLLIGEMGATFGSNSSVLGTLYLDYTDQIFFKLGLFVAAFVVLILFTLKFAAKKTKEEKYEDKYLGSETSKRSPVALWITLAIVFVLFILGCTNWSGSFGVEVFSKFHTWLMGISIKDFSIFGNILGGSVVALGNWTYFQVSILLMVAGLILACIYKVKAWDAIVDGVKTIIKPALLVVFSYGILIIIVNSGIFTTLMSYVLPLLKKFNVLSAIVSVIINAVGSFLHVELTYVANFYLPYLVSGFTKASAYPVFNVIIPASYALTMFVAPTSLFLLLGLTYLEIPYCEWLKKVWKLVVALLLVIIILIIIMIIVL